MSQFYVVAQYESLDEANVGLQVLSKLGMEQEAISLVTSTPLKVVSSRDGGVSSTLAEQPTGSTESLSINRASEPQGEDVVDKLKAPSVGSAATGAGAGAALATGLALPLAVTTAVAPFFVAGPLFAAVVGALGELRSVRPRANQPITWPIIVNLWRVARRW